MNFSKDHTDNQPEMELEFKPEYFQNLYKIQENFKNNPFNAQEDLRSLLLKLCHIKPSDEDLHNMSTLDPLTLNEAN